LVSPAVCVDRVPFADNKMPHVGPRHCDHGHSDALSGEPGAANELFGDV
jgi:hypothetical protein